MQKILALMVALSALPVPRRMANAEDKPRTPKTPAEQPTRARDTLIRPLRAACTTAGTPSEFPDGIVIVNKSTIALKAGRKIKWTFPDMSRSGTVVLVADLLPGESIFKPGVNPGGIEAGAKCKASVL